jgi:hypothetical protein
MTPDNKKQSPRRWTIRYHGYKDELGAASLFADNWPEFESDIEVIEASAYDAIEAELQRERRKVEKLRECAEFYKPGEFPWSADSEFDNGQFEEETLAELEAIDKGEE